MRALVAHIGLLWCSGLIVVCASLAVAPRPIQRVAIIGSGIAGLSTAHALSSLLLSDVRWQVYDSRLGLDPLVGAGIQLNGGLKILGDIDPRVQQAVIKAGLSLDKIQSLTRVNGKLETLLELPLKETIERGGAKELQQSDGTVLWTSIMRGTLQQTLFDTLPGALKRDVHFKKTLTDIKVENEDVYCCFSDGTKTGPFDLIIGCDGIKSAVKEYVERGVISLDSSRREGTATGIYTGIRIRYAVEQNAAKKSTATAPITFTQFFGKACYCLDGTYGAASSITKSVFAIFLDPDYFGPFRRRKGSRVSEENADWSQDNFTVDKGARELMLRQLNDADLAENALIKTVEQADRFFELGVYAHNPFCKWSKAVEGSRGVHVVLCGDAAHALPPFLGQGSNQAIQDSYSLATGVHRYNEALARKEGVSISSYLKNYESARWMPNFQIFWKAAFLGYLETGGFDGVYSWFRNSLFKTLGIIGFAQRVLLGAATPKV